MQFVKLYCQNSIGYLYYEDLHYRAFILHCLKYSLETLITLNIEVIAHEDPCKIR